jgi:7,8-dihydropterin-6-yl-methyl-4-(beta-D-ribofuranosyl)aminobenzene 5'-phosphate synthase
MGRRRIKITVLSEVKAMEGFLAEHGLSFLVEADGQQVLFDTGASDIFLKNAGRLGIDLQSVPTVVLSHGHWDHGDGLPFIQDKKLVCHPGCLVKRYRKQGSDNLGFALSRQDIEKNYSLALNREPYQLTEHLFFLGEIPRKNDFEGGEEDFILDDSGLVYVGEKGLVIVSGCAHAGICNMIEYAVEVTGIQQVEAVIGGFHLKRLDATTLSTIEYLKDRKVKRVMPSHCTKDPALEAFHRAFGMNEVKAGGEYLF